MQLMVIHEGIKSMHPLSDVGAELTIGRRDQDGAPGLDLSPDMSVSRRHARVILDADARCWIEDLGSRVGTFLNGNPITVHDRHPIRPGDVIRIGETLLHLKGSDFKLQPTREAGAAANANSSAAPEGNVTAGAATASRDKLLDLLKQVTQSLAQNDAPGAALRLLVKGLAGNIPGATHVALLLIDRDDRDMVLAAHEPEGDPRVSMTLVKQAIQQNRAVAWVRPVDDGPEEMSESINLERLESVLCAPLIWHGKCLGALWVSGPSGASFAEAGLKAVETFAQLAAVAISSERLTAECEGSTTTLKHIMRQFSPKIAGRLLGQAKQGRFRPGGIRSEVTILCCDLRGFTRATAGMAADDVVDMLNVYFAELSSAIQRNEGTIDKFIGDAILAVFGSPEPDAEQHAHAVVAAREMQQAMRRVNQDRAARKLLTLELGVGVHCGTVLHGFIGSEERLEFTVIGDAVNKTSRFCDGAGPGEVVISPELYQLVWRKVKARKSEIHTKHEGALPAFVLLEQ